MADADAITFTRLSDGTLLRRDSDGAFRPVTSETDRAGLTALTEAAIEHMAASDPDHPGLDDAFWDGAEEASAGASPTEGSIPVRLDGDVVRYFRRAGRNYRARINAVLRQHMRTDGKAG